MGADGLLPLYDLVALLGGARSVYRSVVTVAELRPGVRVLEVGCGTGNLTLTAARAQPDADVVGLDPDERALHRARRKARRAGLAVRFDHGYAQALPYPDSSQDRVLSSLMLHHLGRGAQREMLSEICRVLVPAGLLLLADIAGPTGLHGLLGRKLHARHVGDLDAIRELIATAGLIEVTQLDPIDTRLGRLGLFRAVAP